MKRPFLHRIFFLFVLIVLTTSCSSNLDFNQKIGELSPYFEVTDIFNAEVFNNSTSPTIPVVIFPTTYPFPSQTIPFDINTKLTDKGIVSYLKKVVFHATFTNTTNTTFTIKVIFRNGSVPLTNFTTEVIVPKGMDTRDISFYESDIPNLKSVTNIQITGSFILTSPTIPSGKLIVTSDAKINL
jgi:hypothetical protein